jgi:hypothetical protein
VKRIAFGFATALCLLAPAGAAVACNSSVPLPALPGETGVELIARGHRMRQDGFRAQADAVFLARVDAARMVTSWEANYSLTPLFALYGTDGPADDLVLRSPVLQLTCDVQPELGRLYIVYADRDGASWRVNQLVRHEDFQDRPPGMPTARDVARGFYAPPPSR